MKKIYIILTITFLLLSNSSKQKTINCNYYSIALPSMLQYYKQTNKISLEDLRSIAKLPESFTTVFFNKILDLALQKNDETVCSFLFKLLKIKTIKQDQHATILYANKSDFKQLYSEGFGPCLGIVSYGINGFFLGHFSTYNNEDILQYLKEISPTKITLILNPNFVDLDPEDMETDEEMQKTIIANGLALKEYLENYYQHKIPIELRFFNIEANETCSLRAKRENLYGDLYPESDNPRKIIKMQSDIPRKREIIEQSDPAPLKKIKTRNIIYEILSESLDIRISENLWDIITNPNYSIEQILEQLSIKLQREMTFEYYLQVQRIRSINFAA